jgi:osmotically-inducible protein OsmY
VNGGIVTLSGTVASYPARTTAEKVALRVFGVNAVANDLTVHLPTAFERNDTDIAQAAVNALDWNTLLPKSSITPIVSNGWVTLTGKVDWHYELGRNDALAARRVNVTATDGKVIPSGNVRTWAERREAERAAWAAPGVSQVEDRLNIVREVRRGPGRVSRSPAEDARAFTWMRHAVNPAP